MDQEEKEVIIDKFLSMKRKGHLLYIDLLFKGMEAEAETINRKNAELSEKIDRLLADIMQDWKDNTGNGIVEELRKSNEKIQNVIREIKKDIETAKNIVKVLGHIDEAIKMAVDLTA